MARYIDADLMFLPDGCTTFSCDLTLSDDTDLQEWINAQPTADVKPVVYGEWKYPLGMAWNYICSECGYGNSSTLTKTNFCPNCGADMREEK